MPIRVWHFLIFIMIFVCACSHQGYVWNHPSSKYKKFLSSRVQEKELYEMGRVILKVRALIADESLIEAQKSFTPAHQLSLKKDHLHLIIALEMTGRESFEVSDFKFLVNGTAPSFARELSHMTEIEQHYPFAYPYMRVFVLEIPSVNFTWQETNQLSVQSRVGVLDLKLPYKRSSEEPVKLNVNSSPEASTVLSTEK